jgi:hypothetical protein
MTSSHELARLLLARRDNDVRIEVLIDDDPTGASYDTHLVELRCDDTLIDPDLRAGDVVAYHPTSDFVVIRTGAVTTTDPEDHPPARTTVVVGFCGHARSTMRILPGGSWLHIPSLGPCSDPPATFEEVGDR